MKWITVLLVFVGVAFGEWYIETVNNCDGGYVSLTVDSDGTRHISHGIQSLWYVSSTLSSWEALCLENQGLNINSSIAVESYHHFQHVVYSHDHELVYHHWNGAGWYSETIDSDCDGNTSIALNSSEFPCVTFYGDTDLKYCSWNGSEWNTKIIDSECGSSVVSLAMNSSDEPVITYASIMEMLKIATWTGSQWEIALIDSNCAFLCEGISMALDSSGNPHIACRRDMDVYYYSLEGSQWVGEVVDTAMCTPLSTVSLVLDSEDNPHIAYNALTASSSTIVYLYQEGPTWMREELDQGSSPSIIIDSWGDPAIAYGQGVDGVKYISQHAMGISGGNPCSGLLRSVRPNPAGSVVWLDVNMEIQGSVVVTFCDLSGRTIHRQNFSDLQKGTGTLEVELGEVPSGVYFCRVTNSEFSAETLLTILR